MSKNKNTVNENSEADLTITFYDRNGDTTVPSTIKYKINDYETGVLIRDYTAIPPLSTVIVTLLPGDNTIIDSTLDLEKKTVTVVVDEGTVGQEIGEIHYWVKNLMFYGD